MLYGEDDGGVKRLIILLIFIGCEFPPDGVLPCRLDDEELAAEKCSGDMLCDDGDLYYWCFCGSAGCQCDLAIDIDNYYIWRARRWISTDENICLADIYDRLWVFKNERYDIIFWKCIMEHDDVSVCDIPENLRIRK